MAIETADGDAAGRGGPLLPGHGADARRRAAEHLRLSAARRRAALPGHPAAHALRHHVRRRARPITDCTRGWLPSPDAPMRGSILRGWRSIVEHGYAAVYQDYRGRYGSEGEDRVYADDAADGYDTLEWIAAQPWCNRRSACPAPRPAPRRRSPRPRSAIRSLRAFFTQVGGSSIYDDVVYEGNVDRDGAAVAVGGEEHPGPVGSRIARRSCARFGLSAADLDDIGRSARARYTRLDSARHGRPAVSRLARTGCTSRSRATRISRRGSLSSTRSSPPGARRLPRPAQLPRARSTIPGFHVTSWYDIFQTSVDRRLQGHPGAHRQSAPVDRPERPLLRLRDAVLAARPVLRVVRPLAAGQPRRRSWTSRRCYYSPRAWVPTPAAYVADDWRHAERWPPPGVTPQRLYLRGDGSLGDGPGGGRTELRLRPAPPDPDARRPQHD